MGLMMLFYPCPEEGDSYPRLRESGELEIEFAKTPSNPPVEQRLMRLLRRLGYWTDRALIQRPGMGQGLHFAATLHARPTVKEFVQEIKRHAGQRAVLLPVGARFAMAAVKVARSVGLPIPVDPGQIRSLHLNEDSHWQSDLPDLLRERLEEFQLSYALDQLKAGV